MRKSARACARPRGRPGLSRSPRVSGTCLLRAPNTCRHQMCDEHLGPSRCRALLHPRSRTGEPPSVSTIITRAHTHTHTHAHTHTLSRSNPPGANRLLPASLASSATSRRRRNCHLTHSLTEPMLVSLQRDARPAVQAAAALDRRREEGRRLHGPPSRRPQQSRGGGRAAGQGRQGRSRPAERQPTDGPAPRGRATAHADRQGQCLAPPRSARASALRSRGPARIGTAPLHLTRPSGAALIYLFYLVKSLSTESRYITLPSLIVAFKARPDWSDYDDGAI
jgi:hypothetical protein